jgi:hypothetical protein
MITPEGKVKNKVKKVLKSLGAYYVMPATGGYGSSGAPDFLICYNGRFIGVECKAGGNQPTALQSDNLTNIRNAGGWALVVNEQNVGELEELLMS